MGRFYQTASPQFVDDKMFQLPVDLMGQVIQAKDKAVDTEITSAVNLFDKLKADVYESDLPRAKQIISEKEDTVNGIIESIRKDPMNYNKYSSQIRTLSRDINHTWNTGEIAGMEKNNRDIISKIKDIHELHKDDASYAEAAIKRVKDSYAKGLMYDDVTGAGKGRPDLRQTYQLKHSVDDFIKTKLNADEWEREKDSRGGDGYIYRSKKTREILSPEKIGQAYQQYFNAHQDIQDAVADRTSLGLTGFENPDLANAISYDDKGNVKKVGTDWYGRNIGAAIANMKYSKIGNSDTINNDQGYWEMWKANREDAKNAVEQVGWSYNQVADVDANSAKTYHASMTGTNEALKSSYDKILASSGIKPESEIGKRILSGNSHDIETAIKKIAEIDPATAQQVKGEYQSFRTQKNFLDAQATGFKTFAQSKGVKIDTQDSNWITKHEKLYTQYLEKNNSLGKKNIVDNTVTLDKVGVDPKTIKIAQETVVQNFDDLSFNVDQSQKGSYLTFEQDNGNKVIYVPRDYKWHGKPVSDKGIAVSIGKTKDTPAHTVTYKTAPGGMLSVGSLINDGLVRTIPASGDDEDAKPKYVTRYNGKEVGIVPDEKTLGLSNKLDNAGGSNYGMTMQIGSYRLPVSIPTSALNIKSVDKYVQDNYDDLQFNHFLDKTNMATLGRTTAKGPAGSTFISEGSKVYAVEANGTKHEITAPEQRREILKIIFAEQ